ncbi:Rhodanese-related sulfurtransferase [Ekhidna lutea]|uniref:Rhodanese-related sulfurtransferase n=1 Tax=Ekhidna lutea TaxID=447679 RepID=A0A239HYQ5_EKHLU|nr:rhodanese-like domain-containing protein [Ekhidna lutea]SNS86616.1 Rhodanese-related sulfurtransferase [Ekhidna lutea]
MNEDITCQEVKDRLEKGDKFNFIDVREEWEYEEANIGATLIPLGDLPTRISEIESMKNEEIIVHCKSGARSGRAKKFLNSQGFTNVRNMEGGITAYLEL